MNSSHCNNCSIYHHFPIKCNIPLYCAIEMTGCMTTHKFVRYSSRQPVLIRALQRNRTELIGCIQYIWIVCGRGGDWLT